MALTLVLGPANSAKAGEVLGAYRLAAERDALLVVPTTLDAAHYERELAQERAMLGRALTFPLLISEIADRVGFTGARLGALQKQRLLRRVVRSLELRALADSADSPGFTRTAAELIASLRQARASAPRFASALTAWASERPAQQEFAHDLGTLFLRYQSELDRRGAFDPEAFAWEVLDRLRERPDRWRGTPVYLYGFDDLTAVELDAITTLAGPAGAQVTVSLTYEGGRGALAARATVVEDLRAHSANVLELPALEDYYAPSARRALHHLERNLFEPVSPALDPGETVALLEAGGERAEAELVAEEVERSLAAGIAPAETVVVCRSPARSAVMLERALARRGIPSTCARRVALAHTSLGRGLIAALRCAVSPTGASGSDLLAYLRTPGLVADRAELDAFEAELRQTGAVRLAEARALPRARGLPLAPIDRLRERRDPAAAIAELARELLVAPRRGQAALLSVAESLDARALAVIDDALAQVQGIDETLEQLLELLEGLEVPAWPQPGGAAVLIADPLSIRARRFRHVLVTGLCEGEFPSQTTDGEPFLGEDGRRELALASGLVLPEDEDPTARERYLLYAALSRATERITLSYRSADEDGDQVLASSFLDDLERLFGSDWRSRRRRRLLGELDPALAAAARVPAPDHNGVRRLGVAALRHVRHTEVVSGNALESFAACPVRWLVESQLNPNELRPEPQALAKGSFVHRVLERVIAGLDAPLSTANLPAAEAAMRAAITDADVDFAPGSSGEVRAALLRGIEADLRRYLRFEAENGNGWDPGAVELRFGMGGDEEQPGLVLGDGEHQVTLRGVIDRVDREPGAARAIVRDYKSGTKQLDWAGGRWVDGHKLQVALYMLAVRRLLALEPVAGFYHPLTGGDLRPRGVYLSGVDVGGGTYPNDGRSAAELDELLEQVEREAVALAGRLRGGELTPCPETCSGGYGGGCRHPGICWAQR